MIHRRFLERVAAAGVAFLVLSGCGPNRASVLSQAAQQQAAIATGPIGTPGQVRQQARNGAQILQQLSAIIVGDPGKINPQVVALIAADSAQISSGLDAIADSKTDDQFTASVFNMCDSQRRAAAPRVGQLLVGLANAIRAKPPANVPVGQVEQQAVYFNTFGERMINIPTECDRAQAGMAEASSREQQAEAEHQSNVTAAVNAAELIFAGAVVYGSTVSAAQASRPIVVQSPPVQNNYYY